MGSIPIDEKKKYKQIGKQGHHTWPGRYGLMGSIPVYFKTI